MTKPLGLDDPRLCGCGCGLTFTKREVGGFRRYAPGCKSPCAKKARESSLNAFTRARATGWDKPRYTGGARVGLRPKQDICLECCDLPHRRPASGCPKCRRPYLELAR